MSENARRYLFKGHAVGVAAQFHRLGELNGLDHVVPAQGAAVLPVTGGLSHSRSSAYSYCVDEPFTRTLLSVCHTESKAHGRQTERGFQTEISSRIEDLHVLEKLHIRAVELHLSSEKNGDEPTQITTTGNRIDGMLLGNVQVEVDLDQETLAHCGTKHQLADFCARHGAPQIREHDGYYLCTLV